MPVLEIHPTVRIQAGLYTAEISPSAGGRLLSLTYTDANQALDCIVPWHGRDAFEAHDWPKAGAFVMLPFTNRLAPAQFNWQDQTITLHNGSRTGQGLHGFGHRRPWQLRQTSPHSAQLALMHLAENAEWPWPFEATLIYQLSENGLHVELSVCNTSTDVMPLSLGWHPFLPHSRACPEDLAKYLVRAQRQHAIGLDGLGLAVACVEPLPMQSFALLTEQAGTIAFEQYSGTVHLPLTAQWHLEMTSLHAAHLLVHTPPGLKHLCVEPISALPGALKQGLRTKQPLGLGPGCTRKLVCTLGLQALSASTAVDEARLRSP
jgi:aldose 1-epimerase